MKNNTIKNIETMKNMKSENSLMWNENNELLNSLNLKEGEIDYQIYMFNLYLEAQIDERYDDCMSYLEDLTDKCGREVNDKNPHTYLDFNFDVEAEWVDYVVNVAEWTQEQALAVYKSRYGIDIYDEDDICRYIYDNYDNVYDVCCGDCEVYLKNPFDEDNSEE